MKRIILLLFICFTLIKTYSQEKTDSIKSCCNKDSLLNKGEDGLEARFPGGDPAFHRWLNKSFTSRYEMLEGSGLQGNCMFKFLIDTTGKITEIQFCSMKGTLAETVVREIFAKSPLWQPAVSTKRGRVTQWFCQNLIFQYGLSE
jgi:hypothetical protein